MSETLLTRAHGVVQAYVREEMEARGRMLRALAELRAEEDMQHRRLVTAFPVVDVHQPWPLPTAPLSPAALPTHGKLTCPSCGLLTGVQLVGKAIALDALTMDGLQPRYWTYNPRRTWFEPRDGLIRLAATEGERYALEQAPDHLEGAPGEVQVVGTPAYPRQQWTECHCKATRANWTTRPEAAAIEDEWLVIELWGARGGAGQ